jgi:hypothetical protein
MADRISRPPGRPKGTPKTGGRSKGTPNKATVEVRTLCQRLIEDPEYQTRFKARLLEGALPPGVEQMVWGYAYGKPKETVELQGDAASPIQTIMRVIVDPRDASRPTD